LPELLSILHVLLYGQWTIMFVTVLDTSALLYSVGLLVICFCSSTKFLFQNLLASYIITKDLLTHMICRLSVMSELSSLTLFSVMYSY